MKITRQNYFKTIFIALLMMMGTYMTTNASEYKVDANLKLDPENTMLLELKGGMVVIELRPDLAPAHVARMKELVNQGFYNGIVFHRVIDGFMAQTGDPTGTGMGGSGKNLKAEFSEATFARGTIGMARAADPDSADSQFFICFKPAAFLDRNYTIIGNVVAGMEFVDKIKRGVGNGGTVSAPQDTIISLKMMSSDNL